MHGNAQGSADQAGTHAANNPVGNATAARVADVSAEIAVAGALGQAPLPGGRRPIKANNLGLIGVKVKCRFSGDEMDLPVSLELYEDLDSDGLQTYLSDAARRLGACEPISEKHRLFLLPDSY